MSTVAISGAMAGSAAASAAAAQHAARIAQCYGVEQQFDAHHATIGDKQEYASCIEVLHPHPISDGWIIVAKLFFALCLLGIFVGGWFAHQEDNDWMDYIMYGFLLGAGLPLLSGVLAFLVVGTLWLFGIVN